MYDLRDDVKRRHDLLILESCTLDLQTQWSALERSRRVVYKFGYELEV